MKFNPQRKLKYFSLEDDKETLKTKLKKLAWKHHPDMNIGNEERSNKTMQEINEEFKYCMVYSGYVKTDEAGAMESDATIAMLLKIYNGIRDDNPDIRFAFDFFDPILDAMLNPIKKKPSYEQKNTKSKRPRKLL